MIRVNLIRRDSRADRRLARMAAAAGAQLPVVLLPLSTALTIGWWSWSLRETSNRLDAHLAQAEAAANAMSSAAAELERLELRRSELLRRIAMAQQLPNDSAVVPALDVVADSVPPDVWLLELAQKNRELTLKGLTATLSSLSRLVRNLEATGLFKGPVEIIDSEKTIQADAGALVKFSVKATIEN